MSVIGIDLGASAVKVMVLHRVGRRWEVQEQDSEPVLAQDVTVEDGDEGARFAALDRLIAAHPAWQSPPHEVVALWSAGRATVRRLDMPFRDRAQIEQTLPFTVEGEVPFDIEDMVLGWRVLKSADTSSVLALLAPHEQLGDWLSALRTRRVNPKQVFVDADALALLAEGEGVQAVVDVGHSRTLVSVIDGEMAHRIRSIDLGGKALTEAIQAALGCTWAQAEELKHGADATDSGAGPTASLPDKAREAVELQLASLLAEVRTSLIAAEDDLGVSIESVVLTGGGSRLALVEEFLREDLGVPVSRGTQVEDSYALAYAAARLGANPGGARSIDLRIGDLAYRGGSDILRTAALAMGAFVSCGTMVGLALFMWSYHALGVQIEQVDQQIIDLVTNHVEGVSSGAVSTTTAEPILREKLEAARRRADLLSTPEEPPHLSRFNKISKTIQVPPERLVDVQSYSSTKGNITFEAETDNYAASAAIEEALKRLPCFEGATSQDKGKNRNKVRFSVSIPLSPECGGEEEGS